MTGNGDRPPFAGHDAAPLHGAAGPLRVAISGASGLLGTALADSLASDGHEVLRLVRRDPDGPGEIYWSPSNGVLDTERLDGLDAFVNLSGKNLASGLWTAKRKRELYDSRVGSTLLVAGSLAGLERPPRVLVNASAIGYYGSRGDEVVDETAGPGEGFLAGLCRDWEDAVGPAEGAGVRVVRLRTGLVVSGKGGPLAKMLLPFRLGLGGKLGDGRQYMSWIAHEDVTRAIRLAIEREDLRGPVNVVAPNPVTNAEFTRTVGRVLGRPTFLAVPRFAIRLLGEFGRETMLASTRVHPKRLEDAGFVHHHPDLTSALQAALA